MKASQMMVKNFRYATTTDDIIETSIKMEEHKNFTLPVLNPDHTLDGWITCLDINKGLREGKKTVSEIMHPVEEIFKIRADEQARIAVCMADKKKIVNMPVLDDNNKVVGMIRSCDMIKTFSALYDIKVYKLYEAMLDSLKGVNWQDLMEASAVVSTKQTGVKITAGEYEENIKKATFGEAIWATDGLEKFFAGLISVGELVIARKIGRARK